MLVKSIVFAAIALGGAAVGMVSAQVVYGPKLASLTAKVTVLTQAASRCETDAAERRAFMQGAKTFAKPYTGPEL